MPAQPQHVNRSIHQSLSRVRLLRFAYLLASCVPLLLSWGCRDAGRAATQARLQANLTVAHLHQRARAVSQAIADHAQSPCERAFQWPTHLPTKPYQRQSILHVSYADDPSWQLTLTTTWREDDEKNLDWQEEVVLTQPNAITHQRQLRRVNHQWFSSAEGGPWIQSPDLNAWAIQQVMQRDLLFLRLAQAASQFTPQPQGHMDNRTPYTSETFPCQITTAPSSGSLLWIQTHDLISLQATPPTSHDATPHVSQRRLVSHWRIKHRVQQDHLKITLDDTLTHLSTAPPITTPTPRVKQPASPCLTQAADHILYEVHVQYWQRDILSVLPSTWSKSLHPMPPQSPISSCP